MVSRVGNDIASGGKKLVQDIYGNYDTLNRSQQVSQLDGTTENTHYACCGIDYTVDRLTEIA